MVFLLNRYYLPSDILKTVCYSLFDAPLHYAYQIQGQDNSDVVIQRA